MPGMSGGGEGGPSTLRLRARDVDGRPVSVPDGRPGVVLVTGGRGCPRCTEIAKLVRRTRPSPAVVILRVRAGSPNWPDFRVSPALTAAGARYVDAAGRNVLKGTGSTAPGDAVVYSAAGRVVLHVRAGDRRLTAALREAAAGTG